MKTELSNRAFGLVVVVVLIVGAIYGLEKIKPEAVTSSGGPVNGEADVVEAQGDFEPAKEIVNPSGFINTDGIKIADLVGKKVILVDFWTYSCINCQRTLPYLTDWYEKYKDQGLEIVAVHTPEFEFEKEYANVLAATKKFGVEYPVVLDNDYGTWRAYGNRYWPRKYLIDINGQIVYDHIGEGAYEETEGIIQDLLEERAEKLGESTDAALMPLTQETEGTIQAGSPEVYFGSSRNELLANGQPGKNGTQALEAPVSTRINQLYLDGMWNFSEEYAENTAGGAKIVFPYQAKDVYMVARSDNPVRVMVKRDGENVGEITVREDQLYTLIDGDEAGEHTLELIIIDPGLQAFTFTFG